MEAPIEASIIIAAIIIAVSPLTNDVSSATSVIVSVEVIVF